MTSIITEPGIYPELSCQYQVRASTPTRALSYSGIKILLNETPLDFITPKPRKSEALGFGAIVHRLALGKGSEFEISPFDEYRTKDARAWRDDYLAAGKIPIKAEQYSDAERCASVIRARIFEACNGEPYETEVPFFWKEGETWFSGMMDVWCPSLNLVIDPKTTAKIATFQTEISRFGYHVQSTLYRRGLDAIRPEFAGRHQFKLLAVSTEEPFLSRLISISEGWRTGAEMDIEHAKAIFERCMANDEWPGYPSEEIMDEPSWQMRARMERELENETDSD